MNIIQRKSSCDLLDIPTDRRRHTFVKKNENSCWELVYVWTGQEENENRKNKDKAKKRNEAWKRVEIELEEIDGRKLN